MMNKRGNKTKVESHWLQPNMIGGEKKELMGLFFPFSSSNF